MASANACVIRGGFVLANRMTESPPSPLRHNGRDYSTALNMLERAPALMRSAAQRFSNSIYYSIYLNGYLLVLYFTGNAVPLSVRARL